MNKSTYSNKIEKTLTIKDLKKISIHIDKKEEGGYKDLPWFTKMMNKFGWHRKYEVMLIDSQNLKNYWFKDLKIPKITI